MTDRNIDLADDGDPAGIAMAKAREKFAQKIDASKKGRKARQKKLTDSVDGRSLRETGRTAQFNFRALEDLKPRAQAAADRRGMTLAMWMEEAVEAYLAREANDG